MGVLEAVLQNKRMEQQKQQFQQQQLTNTLTNMMSQIQQRRQQDVATQFAERKFQQTEQQNLLDQQQLGVANKLAQEKFAHTEQQDLLGQQQQLLDNKLAQDKFELQKTTAASKAAASERQQSILQQAMQGGGGNFPVGTTITSGGMTIPLNPRLTDDTKKSVAGGELVSQSADKIISLVNEGIGTNYLDQMYIQHAPFVALKGKRESFKSELNRLKATIPFAKGGKQLTPFEAKLLFSLVETVGKEKDTIINDLERFKVEFNRLGELAKQGAAGIKDSSSGQENTKTDFTSISDANAANLPKGTPITVNGRPGVVE